MPATLTPALIALPHSGLHVPHPHLRVITHRSTARDSDAFFATLCHGRTMVGTIHNDGCGGGTRLRLRDSATFDAAQFDAFAAECRSRSGVQVSGEDVLNDLVTEFVFTMRVQKARLGGHSVARRMEFAYDAVGPVGDPYIYEALNVATPRTSDERAAMVAALEHRPISVHGWWDLWTGERWEQVTRPAVPVR